ncbi:hypothetical protein [Marinilabilia salmonicolor]|uniref:hypothetical protein n=1 Tax=Marinilabilia salmonicolor TaxID=989 RepID=UPI00029B3816|nr:hypothetical protein [Marinilabilia salmonicolor]
MWVRTQCKKQLVKIIRITIERNIGSKNKAALVGQFADSSLFQSNQVVLGEYKTKEDALAELTSIQDAIAKGENHVYQIQ